MQKTISIDQRCSYLKEKRIVHYSWRYGRQRIHFPAINPSINTLYTYVYYLLRPLLILQQSSSRHIVQRVLIVQSISPFKYTSFNKKEKKLEHVYSVPVIQTARAVIITITPPPLVARPKRYAMFGWGLFTPLTISLPPGRVKLIFTHTRSVMCMGVVIIIVLIALLNQTCFRGFIMIGYKTRMYNTSWFT